MPEPRQQVHQGRVNLNVVYIPLLGSGSPVLADLETPRPSTGSTSILQSRAWLCGVLSQLRVEYKDLSCTFSC
jgi:hypothetical protein